LGTTPITGPTVWSHGRFVRQYDGQGFPTSTNGSHGPRWVVVSVFGDFRLKMAEERIG
jgi:hypothetical protein